ncbi:MAG TPA: 3-oxoacyl-[acyl-carrier-protein] synthase III C-terminal domain-containing protein [Kofleriaceae bacterium]
MDTCVGIHAVALYLPPVVRHNDWWPGHIVASWRNQRRPPPPARPLSPGELRVAAAMCEQAADPFQSAVARHVMPPDMTVLDMAEQAGRAAIARAGVAGSDIDLLLTSIALPDVLLGNPACELHHRLGLPRRCFALETSAATYSFLMQLTLAQAMIATGSARLALLVQACGVTHLVDREDPISPLFGDGATAVVVGPVSDGRGIRAAAHHADGRFPNTLVASVRGGRWYDAGRGEIHVADPVQMRDVFLATADICKESIDAVLAKSGLTTRDVGFFAMHQGTPWIHRVIQDHAGLGHARSIESFSRTGYLFASTIPAGLALADGAGLLADDDLVLATAGGPGVTFGSIAMRWGSR